MTIAGKSFKRFGITRSSKLRLPAKVSLILDMQRINPFTKRLESSHFCAPKHSGDSQ